MIAIDEDGDLMRVSVFGELTLNDYRQFEQAVTNELKSSPPGVNLLIDVRGMTGFTVDVAWEEIKFTRAHAHDFRRIAVVTQDEWAPWLSWVSAAFSDADVMLFEDAHTAATWLRGGKP